MKTSNIFHAERHNPLDAAWGQVASRLLGRSAFLKFHAEYG